MTAATVVEYILSSRRRSGHVLLAVLLVGAWSFYKFAGVPTVYGRVTAFGRPVVGANVHTSRYQGGSTDGEGRYAMSFDDDDRTFLCVEPSIGAWSWNTLSSPLFWRNLEFDIDLGSTGAAGTVVDAETGRSIADAVIEFRGTKPGSMSISTVVRSDESGHWVTGAIEPDHYRISIEDAGGWVFKQDLDLSDGHFAEDLVVQLAR